MENYRAHELKVNEREVHLKKEERRKIRKQQKSSSNQLRKRGHLGRRAPSPERRKQSVRIRRVVGRQASIPLLISVKVR